MTIPPIILSLLREVAIFFPAFLFSLTFIQYFEALVAHFLGDNTPAEEGFLTLNPFVHVNVMVLFMITLAFGIAGQVFGNSQAQTVALLAVFMLSPGWHIPLPVNFSNFKNLKLGAVLISLSRTAGSIVCSFILLVILRLLQLLAIPQHIFLACATMLAACIQIALFIGVLGLIPIPPFAASRMLPHILPLNKLYIYEWLERYALFILLALFFLPGISTVFFGLIHIIESAIYILLHRLVF